MNPDYKKKDHEVIGYKIQAVLSETIVIGEEYNEELFADACAKAVVLEDKYLRLTKDYDIKIRITEV